ncbi:NAC domain-containing protein 102-like isoform X2 [Euphorbia lathyris]|uniref:NAC domain-containing protein 102-like isoform X2 n=1 Tax=Euphorbia lathyris TaxID=212925 RepID=UPI0033137E4F
MANNISLPVGFQFSPTDEELLGLFLSQRENLPPFYPIQVADVYADKEPWLLFDKDVQQIHYVFVELKKKTNKSKMIKRTAGCGTWSGQDVAKPVKDRHGLLLGFKKLLIFEFPNDAGDKGHWIMHEYSSTKKNDAYVLCAIRNKQLDNIVEPAKNATKKRSLQKHGEIHPSKRACNSVRFGSTNQGAIEKIGNQQKANPTEACRYET